MLGKIIWGYQEQGNGTDGNKLECLFCLNVCLTFFPESAILHSYNNTLILRNQVSATKLTKRLGIRKNLLNMF